MRQKYFCFRDKTTLFPHLHDRFMVLFELIGHTKVPFTGQIFLKTGILEVPNHCQGGVIVDNDSRLQMMKNMVPIFIEKEGERFLKLQFNFYIDVG